MTIFRSHSMFILFSLRLIDLGFFVWWNVSLHFSPLHFSPFLRKKSSFACIFCVPFSWGSSEELAFYLQVFCSLFTFTGCSSDQSCSCRFLGHKQISQHGRACCETYSCVMVVVPTFVILTPLCMQPPVLFTALVAACARGLTDMILRDWLSILYLACSWRWGHYTLLNKM